MSDSQIIWRVNRSPRFPVLSMGEYMVAPDGPRETMRRNMKYERISGTILYSKLQVAVAAFLASPVRDKRILDRCRIELEAARDTAATSRAGENATYALRALEAFMNSLNALQVGGLWLSKAPIYRAHIIEGVKVSIQPTVLVSASRSRGKDLVGAVIVDTAKGIEPKTPETISRTTEAMVHASYLLHELVVASVANDDQRPSKEHCMIFHSYRQEVAICPTNYRRSLGNLQAACRDIASQWDRIEPPTSFDPARARYRA
jgi:hypothetical protein